MRVAITHTTRLDYNAAVVEGVMDTRLGPLSDRDQRWERFELRVRPLAAVRQYTDGFNNIAHLITIAKPHEYVEVVTQGEVQTYLADPFAPPAYAPRPLSPLEIADYLASSPLIQRQPALDEIAAAYRPRAPEDTFEAVQGLMQSIYSTFTYRQNVTSVATTVPEVIQGRSGVCQDFAHVLIGLCRALEIPARYVSGYLVVGSQTQSQRLGTMAQSQTQRQGPERGAGASHAWVEAFTPTHGWRGFDPTNNLVASENHIKMAIGRDYSDVPPTRGTYRGLAAERLTVEVLTQRLD